MKKKLLSSLLALLLVFSLAACGGNTQTNTDTKNNTVNEKGNTQTGTPASDDVSNTASVSSGGAVDASELFTERDLKQTADLSGAVSCEVADGEDIILTAAGVYVLTGTAENVTVVVDAGDEDKVQLVLDGLTITNDTFPCIYVKNADKVFVTTTSSDNALSVTGAFDTDGSTNTDAVIFSREDLVFNGLGTLRISSTDNGVSGKDEIRITGGTLLISAADCALEAHDAICVADGTITITAGKDGLHAENDEDDASGFIYICGGTLDIRAGDDGLHATTVFQIDDGEITITAAEGVEATWVQINGGAVSISATDDGINAARKSSAYSVLFEMNGGSLTIVMGSGDTDAIDANGDLRITGGTLDLTCQSPFDYDGSAEYSGGTIIVNGQETDAITNQFFGGPGGMGGGPRH